MNVFGGFYLDSVYPNTTNNYRHVYTFAPISGVTGVRIEVDSDWYVSSFASGGGGAIGVGGGLSDPLQVSANSAYNIGIDELEVYAAAVPEPGTIALLLTGAACLLAFARRRATVGKRNRVC